MYFAENNSYIWNFSVMHDIPGLIEMMGGNESFIERLDNLFNEPTRIAKWQFMGQFPDASGLNGMFPAGNEPSFHVPYLYNYTGDPWKTQRRIREVMEMWFDDDPLGGLLADARQAGEGRGVAFDHVPREFLAALKHKAGLAADFWSAEVRLSRYRVRRYADRAQPGAMA